MPKTPTLLTVLLVSLCAQKSSPAPKAALTPELEAAVTHIRPRSLRGDLSFLASDQLEGRNTPSRGLDIAAEYIAAQFRRAGLEPGGDDGYYQTAKMAVREANTDGFELELSRRDKSFTADPKEVAIDTSAALDVSGGPVFKLDVTDTALVRDLSAEQVDGKVVVTELMRGSAGNARTAFAKLREAKPAAVLMIARSRVERPEQSLIDPETARVETPRILLTGPEAARFYAALKAGLTDAVASIHVAAPRQTPVTLRNVIGILRGSDPVLKDTCILLTAHYDHIGRLADGPGYRIYNVANDYGSGTVSVI